MSDWGILFVLVGEVVILTRLDRMSFGTWITPFSVLAVPYAVVVTAAYCFAPSLGFLSLFVESVWIWIGGLFLFWLGGGLVALLFGKLIRAKARVARPLLYEQESERVSLVLAWLAILVMGYGLRSSLGSLGWQLLGTDEFAQSYGYGWVGHVRCFSMGLAIYLIGTASRASRLKLFTVLILIVLYMAYPTKAWVVVPILAGFIYRASSGRFGLSLRGAALVPLLIYALFVVAYMIAFGVNDSSVILNAEVYGFLTTHFLSYIFSGVMAWGNVVHTGIDRFYGDPHVIVAPFLNLYAVIAHSPLVSNVTENFSVISIAGAESNVNTFFGTILINLGFVFGMVYVVFSGVVVFGLFAFAKVTRNCWAAVAWVFVGALLSLGWFDFYFATLPSIELPAYFLVLSFLAWLLRQRSRRVEGPSPT